MTSSLRQYIAGYNVADSEYDQEMPQSHHGSARKSHRTPTVIRRQEDNQSKATSYYRKDDCISRKDTK